MGRSAVTEPAWVKTLLTLFVLVFLGFFLIVPLCAVFVQAFAHGKGVYLQALRDQDTLSAVRLTLLTALSSRFKARMS
jgi:sulfate transport system permease protein